VVAHLHRRYLDAGARLLTTNTFGGTRLRLALHGEEGRRRTLNRKAAELARSVAGSEAWVMGDVGPCGGILAPLGDVSREDARCGFLEQVEALLEGGVDAILVETMTALEEMVLAVEAARAAGAPLVFASFAFDHMKRGPPRTMMGVAPAEAAAAAMSAGADLVGCNCGTSLTGDDCVDIVRALREATDLPVLASPNAGQPELLPSGVVYHESPDGMARTVVRLTEAGAAVVGGCCGTTPEHIARFREALAGR
jgi:5-methyltetrahydrofolate--homocysteine methyltransferase